MPPHQNPPNLVKGTMTLPNGDKPTAKIPLKGDWLLLPRCLTFRIFKLKKPFLCL